jgi:hypothetical protein
MEAIKVNMHTLGTRLHLTRHTRQICTRNLRACLWVLIINCNALSLHLPFLVMRLRTHSSEFLIPSWSAWVVWLQDASSQVCTWKYSLYCRPYWFVCRGLSICAGLYNSMVRINCAIKLLCIVWYVGCCLKSANFILGVWNMELIMKYKYDCTLLNI